MWIKLCQHHQIVISTTFLLVFLPLSAVTSSSDKQFPVGILTGQPITTVQGSLYTSGGNCTQFSEGTEEDCKYYGDCCNDPMRLRERLEKGTFSCVSLRMRQTLEGESWNRMVDEQHSIANKIRKDYKPRTLSFCIEGGGAWICNL